MKMIDVKFLVVTAITLALGVYVFYSVFNALPEASNATENETRNQIVNNFGTAFKLTAIIGIVLGAAWIMRALNIF